MIYIIYSIWSLWLTYMVLHIYNDPCLSNLPAVCPPHSAVTLTLNIIHNTSTKIFHTSRVFKHQGQLYNFMLLSLILNFGQGSYCRHKAKSVLSIACHSSWLITMKSDDVEAIQSQDPYTIIELRYLFTQHRVFSGSLSFLSHINNRGTLQVRVQIGR